MQKIQGFLPVMVALLIGYVGAIVFSFLHTPLPWLLGSITAVAMSSRFAFIPLQSPKIFSSPARAILGITIGSAFHPEILHYFGSFLSSILLIIPFVFIISFCGMMYYWKFLKFDKLSAYFSAMPGGLLEMVMLAESLGANVYKVTLAQSTRLLLLVFTFPFIIETLAGISLDGRGGITQSWIHSDKSEMVILLVCAFVGWWGALKLKIPGGTMIGPMIIGAFIYSMGWVHSRPPDEVIKLIQLVLGTTVGFVFVGVGLKEVFKVIVNTLGYFVMLMVISTIFIFIVSLVTDFSLISVMLAFSPGGQSEMNLIAIIVGANLPYVALHHIVRMFLVMSVAPIFVKKLRKGDL